MKVSRQLDKRYIHSIEQLLRAEKIIPLGSQTFSKSRTQYPVGVSPHFIDRAQGAYAWDIDGNRYIDLVNSLAAITLGHGEEKVCEAVRNQLEKGVLFSLPGILESEVAELLVELVPSAEMVRFGKNGSDATAAAIRLARAFTGREHIAVCGYHGWQDWYIGSTTRNKGVPVAVSELTHKFEYNNIESLKKILHAHSNKIAAVIMEPMNSQWPLPGFLEKVKRVSAEAGALLVFDETITGFRYSPGGAQELFGVIPDLSTFGKGLANGFPLSAVAGSRKIMMEMEEIFFSGTFGGELLSLAAAKVVLEKHKDGDVSEQLNAIGSKLRDRVEEVINRNSMGTILQLSGHPSWIFLNWKATPEYSVDVLKTFFMQEMFEVGILILGSHNISLAFNDEVIEEIVSKYEGVLTTMGNEIKSGTLREKLRVDPIEPLFRVR